MPAYVLKHINLVTQVTAAKILAGPVVTLHSVEMQHVSDTISFCYLHVQCACLCQPLSLCFRPKKKGFESCISTLHKWFETVNKRWTMCY